MMIIDGVFCQFLSFVPQRSHINIIYYGTSIRMCSSSHYITVYCIETPKQLLDSGLNAWLSHSNL
jgi:hypothetical protein